MEGSNQQELRRLEFHELKDALRPGLFPRVTDWPGVEELASEHEAALQRVREAFQAGKELRDRFQREDSSGRLTTDFSERQALLHDARIAEQAVQQETEAKVVELVWQARDCIEEWRAVEAAVEHERQTEISSLRARLAELETEDITAKRLQVWLNRLDQTKITVELYPWAQLAQRPMQDQDRKLAGPIEQAFKEWDSKQQPDLQEAAE